MPSGILKSDEKLNSVCNKKTHSERKKIDYIIYLSNIIVERIKVKCQWGF